eukprot:Seg2013.7 transcript_id=Seg2013.7/GoldUCD/mRNA.D3Y31 product="Nucleosome-remodeling factor subunit BPTF" protein_id=Seg2013.7/GoldUCD/D3Y31
MEEIHEDDSRDELSNEWELKTLELDRTSSELRDMGEIVIDYENRYARLESVIAGDQKRNAELAQLSDARRKIKKQKGRAETCKSRYCCITTYDTNVNWVACDECFEWFHTFCQCMTQSKEHDLSEQYICLSCSGKENEISEFRDKISALLSEEDDMKRDIVCLKAECNDLKAKLEAKCREKEKN